MLNKIEDIRINNNSLWMDILYIALTHAPEQTKGRIRRIGHNDSRITLLMKMLAE